MCKREVINYIINDCAANRTNVPSFSGQQRKDSSHDCVQQTGNTTRGTVNSTG